jgi:phosphatidylserine decarboxylase
MKNPLDSLFNVLKLVPKNFVSRRVGELAHNTLLPRRVHKQAILAFAKAYGIDLTESRFHSFDAFRTFEDFFIREMKPGTRPIEEGVVSPCDGIIDQGGPLEDGRLEQVKGQTYTLNELFHYHDVATQFENGSFATIYLSPRHYHRVHSPVTGRIERSIYIPGNLWPVNSTSVRKVPGLFARNERICTLIQTPSGKFAVIFVGATIVGHIHLRYDASIATNNTAKREQTSVSYAPPKLVEKGQELGFFTLGSTVIILAEKRLNLVPQLKSEVKYGATLFEDSGRRPSIH